MKAVASLQVVDFLGPRGHASPKVSRVALSLRSRFVSCAGDLLLAILTAGRFAARTASSCKLVDATVLKARQVQVVEVAQ